MPFCHKAEGLFFYAWHKYLSKVFTYAHLCINFTKSKHYSMKLIKAISLGLCLTAFSIAANAQQQTTQKVQGETPATATSELKKTKTEQKTTLTVTERNAAARRHNSAKANGASPSLTDSRSQPTRSTQPADDKRQSTGMRSNTTTQQTNTTQKVAKSE